MQQRKKQEKIDARRRIATEATAKIKRHETKHTAWQKRQVCAAVCASWDPCAFFLAALWLDVHLLQAIAKQKAKHELQESKKDEKERADSKAAASCAEIKHIWQLEQTKHEFVEDAKSCMLHIEEFIRLKCETMAEQLCEEEDLQRAVRSRTTALDGASY